MCSYELYGYACMDARVTVCMCLLFVCVNVYGICVYLFMYVCVCIICDCLSKNRPSSHLPVFREIPF